MLEHVKASHEFPIMHLQLVLTMLASSLSSLTLLMQLHKCKVLELECVCAREGLR